MLTKKNTDKSVEKSFWLLAFKLGFIVEELEIEFYRFSKSFKTIILRESAKNDQEVLKKLSIYDAFGIGESYSDLYVELLPLYELSRELGSIINRLGNGLFPSDIGPWYPPSIRLWAKFHSELMSVFCEFIRTLAPGVKVDKEKFCKKVKCLVDDKNHNILHRLVKVSMLPFGCEELTVFQNFGKFLRKNNYLFGSAILKHKVLEFLGVFVSDLEKHVVLVLPYLPEIKSVIKIRTTSPVSISGWEIEQIAKSTAILLGEIEGDFNLNEYIEFNPTSDPDFPFRIMKKKECGPGFFKNEPILLRGKHIKFKSVLSHKLILMMIEKYNYKRGLTINDFSDVHEGWKSDFLQEDIEENSDENKKERTKKEYANQAVREAISVIRKDLAKNMGLDNKSRKKIIVGQNDKTENCTVYTLNIEYIKECIKKQI